MSVSRILSAFAILIACATPVLAGNFDGSRPLVCATLEARDCVRGEACFQGLPEQTGAPDFVRIDFENKTVTGPHRTTPILIMEQDEQQLLLQGKEHGFAWVLALDQANGRFSGTLTSFDGAFVLFGSCTPL